MSNFSWDWVIEPFVQQLNRSASALEEVSRQYASMAGILRMPLGGISDAFAKVIDVPLVANRSRRTPDEVLRVLRIDPHDDRRRVLFAMRGAISPTVLAAAVASAPDALILCPADEHADIPPGAHPLPIGDDLDFSDVLQVCDVVVGKMGYALTAECILSGATLLWPRRKGFREDAMVERIGPRVMRMHELPLEDFRTGQWAEHIRVAGKLPRPPETMPTDGAEVCASHILAL
jgi:L-arabinokinase